MTTEMNESEQTVDHAAEEAAAFASSFNDEASPAPLARETKPAEPVATEPPSKPEATVPAEPEPEVPTTPEAAQPAPIPAAPDFVTKDELRKVHGRIGEMNDLLRKALQTKEAEGKPAVLTPVELKRIAANFPELAADMSEDIAEAIASLRTVAAPVDPKELDSLVESRVAAIVAKQRVDEVKEAFPTWETDLWAAPGVHTTAFASWRKTLSPAEVERLDNSNSPSFINRKLGEFYEWKNKATQAATEKTERLKGAITPQGVARAAPPAISDDEAMRKAFAESFNDG